MADLPADPFSAVSSFDRTVDISIVVPYYNPGDRLRPTVEHVLRVLSASETTFEVITVSDGSTDGSPNSLGGLPEQLVRQVGYPVNAGKGHALRLGFGQARGNYVGFIDADGDISPEFLSEFVATMQSESPDIIIGTKRHPASVVTNSGLRRFYSCGYQSLVRVLFSLHVKDTQVGIKLINRRVVDDLLPLLRENRFALDLELLVLANMHGFTRIVEAPVRIEKRSGSTISIKAIRCLLADTLAIYWRASVRHDYEPVVAPSPRGRSTTTVNVVEPLPSPVAI